MSKITKDIVNRLASLSYIELSDQEVESLMIDLQNIIDYIDQLRDLDTSNVEPTYQVTNLKNIWRSDVLIDYQVSQEQLLNLASEHSNNSIVVPKVL